MTMNWIHLATFLSVVFNSLMLGLLWNHQQTKEGSISGSENKKEASSKSIAIDAFKKVEAGGGNWSITK